MGFANRSRELGRNLPGGKRKRSMGTMSSTTFSKWILWGVFVAFLFYPLLAAAETEKKSAGNEILVIGTGSIVAAPFRNGLHHRYRRAARPQSACRHALQRVGLHAQPSSRRSTRCERPMPRHACSRPPTFPDLAFLALESSFRNPDGLFGKDKASSPT